MFHDSLQAGIQGAGILDILLVNGCLSYCLSEATHHIKMEFGSY